MARAEDAGCLMRATLRAPFLAAVCAVLLCVPALSQVSPELSNRNIDFIYVPPKSLKYVPLFERLQEFKVLEQLAEFLSPLRLPHKYTLATTECGVINAFYSSSQWRTNLCYEFVEMLERIGPKKGQPSDYTYEEAVVGALVAVMLHENGHAVFDMLDVPVFGREEDAADEMSTFIALQFSPEVALKKPRLTSPTTPHCTPTSTEHRYSVTTIRFA
jgi:Putative metallopeptidase